MNFPFKQKKLGNRLIREFESATPASELVWHRDREDRCVYVKKGNGWQLQLENKLPVSIITGESYFIPKNTFHRLIKGREDLVVEITEGDTLLITEKQLRKMIRNSIIKT